MSSVTIGGQTFIKTEEGWVDKKTKVRAPEGLTKLLDNVAEEESPAGKKKRVRIDTSRPVVKLGKSEYVWDLNGKVWIDRKTKDPVNPQFSKLIEATYQSIEKGVTADDQLYDKSKTAKTVVNNMGTAGQAAKQKARSGSGQLPTVNLKINSPIVAMIQKLAIIDGHLKQKLENQRLDNANTLIAQKEQQIEAVNQDASPVVDQKEIQAEAEQESKKSNAALMATAVGIAGILAYQFKPVKETINSVIDFAKGVFDFTVGIANVLNEGMRAIVGTPESRGETSQNQPVQNQAGSISSGISGAAFNNSMMEDTTPFGAPGSNSSGSGSMSFSSATPDEITTPFPGPTGSTTTDMSPGWFARSTQRSVPSSSGSSAAPSLNPQSSQPAPTTDMSPSWFARSTQTPVTTPAPQSSFSPGWFAQPKQDSTAFSPAPAFQVPPMLQDRSSSFMTSGFNQNSGLQSYRGLEAYFDKPAASNEVDGYINPVEGYSINSGYGMRNHPVQGGKKFHTGVDIAAPAGTPVRAVKSGTVTKISNNQRPYSGFGNAIVVDHGDGYQTVYAHLSKFACKQGDKVKQGQIIGYVGSTGMSTGNHLHFIVQKTGFTAPNAGNTVNPAPLLRKGGVTIPAGMEGYDMESGGAGSSTFEKVASTGLALTEGAMEAVGNILRAAIDSGNMKSVDLGMQMADPTTAQSISKAARERNAAIADAKTDSVSPPSVNDPLNLNSGAGKTATIQNLPTGSDLAGVEFYLTRMGFPKIEYHKPSPIAA